MKYFYTDGLQACKDIRCYTRHTVSEVQELCHSNQVFAVLWGIILSSMLTFMQKNILWDYIKYLFNSPSAFSQLLFPSISFYNQAFASQ